VRIGVTTFGCDLKSGMSRYASNLFTQFAADHGNNQFDVLAHKSAVSSYIRNADGMMVIPVAEWLRNPVLNVAWHQLVLPLVCHHRNFDVLFLPAASRRMPTWAPCPMVGTVHDLTHFHVAAKYDPLRMFYQTRVLPRLIRRLDRIIAISESTKRDLIEYADVPEERVTVIHSAADTSMFYPRNGETAAAQIRNYGVRAPYLLYVSRIEHPGKNHVRLVRAFEILKSRRKVPHQLVLAGVDWLRAEEVHKVARESSVAEDIVFTGYVSSEDLPDLYCGSDMLVFASLFEGFGLPILEAMACGVPVACSNVSSMPEIAGDAAVFFDPLDVGSIVEGMNTLLSSAEVRTDYIEKGLRQASTFSWERTARETLDVIRLAVEG